MSRFPASRARIVEPVADFGEAMLAEAGAREVIAGAAAEFWERTGAAPSVDVNMVWAGEPRTVIPAAATAQLSMRLAPGQSAAEMAAELERLLRAGVPDGAELTVDFDLAEPAPSTRRTRRSSSPPRPSSAPAARRPRSCAGRNIAVALSPGGPGRSNDRERLRARRGRLPRAE